MFRATFFYPGVGGIREWRSNLRVLELDPQHSGQHGLPVDPL